MLAALCTTLFFAVTPVVANRAASLLGSSRANFWRLLVAAVALGAWAHAAGTGLGGPAAAWLVAGGAVGFGIGGLAMFESLPRLGSNLSTLIVQCGSAVAAAALEWGWLGTRLTGLQIIAGAATLAGVIVGMLPRSLPRVSPTTWVAGVTWAAVSAGAQGAGAVFSRKAFAVAQGTGTLLDPGTAAYERSLGGLVVAAAALAVVAARGVELARDRRTAPPWVLANALTGPILGVTFYQWALRTTPAGVVQPIVAAAPLLTIPLAAWLEGSRPRGPYYAGAVLAVAGVTGLMLAH